HVVLVHLGAYARVVEEAPEPVEVDDVQAVVIPNVPNDTRPPHDLGLGVAREAQAEREGVLVRHQAREGGERRRRAGAGAQAVGGRGGRHRLRGRLRLKDGREVTPALTEDGGREGGHYLPLAALPLGYDPPAAGDAGLAGFGRRVHAGAL